MPGHLVMIVNEDPDALFGVKGGLRFTYLSHHYPQFTLSWLPPAHLRLLSRRRSWPDP